MSSTYSPDLRIELIGTGDQAGVWGNTTNTNLSTVLENSIAGYTSVSIIASSQALTANYGAADQARYAAIALTTTTAANFAVYAPPASKLYVIYNASSYVATIYNSTVLGNTTAAGIGVAIPAGKTMTIWSDGTNFAQQNTHLNSPSFTTPALGTPASGTLTNATGLPVATGISGLGTGVATFLATPSSANLAAAVTGETGSGALVFATSPTLVTPALGTPASGVMTNVTGLPLATGVTGTLPVANGGTGVTQATGSGKVVLDTSPTLVSPALGTPASGTLTNTTGLPVATGISGLGTGVATFLATPSSANLAAAVTGETGSGALVFATSPTFVTPALGTPASGVLTSCTGLPLTTGITGTLPVANGGTGVTGSTGSGSVVLSVSPTFTGTPLAPTAAAGTSTTQIATTAFVQAALQALYPIGSIYSSTVSTNPGTLFGFGTWVAYAAGRVMIGDGGGFTAGDTGGSANAIAVAHTHTFGATTGTESASHSHTISISDPGHNHNVTVYASQSDSYGLASRYSSVSNPAIVTTSTATTGITASAGTQSANHTHSVSGTTGSTGSSGTGANLQPYVVVYMWNRVS